MEADASLTDRNNLKGSIMIRLYDPLEVVLKEGNTILNAGLPGSESTNNFEPEICFLVSAQKNWHNTVIFSLRVY